MNIKELKGGTDTKKAKVALVMFCTKRDNLVHPSENIVTSGPPHFLPGASKEIPLDLSRTSLRQ